MLRRIDVDRAWRSLDPGFWPTDVPLGRHSIIYGHNGSGKSTLSELLLGFSQQGVDVSCIWEDDEERETRLGAGATAPPSPIAVFTRQWVVENLNSFLEGDSAEAIVTLGREAIDAQQREEELAGQIEQLEIELLEAQRADKKARFKVESKLRAVQDDIATQLQKSDFKKFSKNQYNLPKVGKLIRKFSKPTPSKQEYTDALQHLLDVVPEAIDEIPPAPSQGLEIESAARVLVTKTPTSVLIEKIAQDPKAQRWVSDGLELHSGERECLFCSSEITAARRAELTAHFDASWAQIRSESKALLQSTRDLISQHEEWLRSLPASNSLAPRYRTNYEAALVVLQNSAKERIHALEKLVGALESKFEDPLGTCLIEPLDAIARETDLGNMPGLIRQHNVEAASGAAVTRKRQQTIGDFLLGSAHAELSSLDSEVAVAESTVRDAEKTLYEKRQLLENTRQLRFSTREMAEALTSDLSRVYGKNYLSISVAEDGKSYSCRRGVEKATHLSEGERMTLSLLYFLRMLQDESTGTVNPSERIVVIDDPCSSLDRESLFATHQWLLDSLEPYGQYIILTHDFGLLRLFIKSHRNQWGKSLSNIRKDNQAERRFPRVSFLELYAADGLNGRNTRVGTMPSHLYRATSEYNYLFGKVMAGVKAGTSDDHLYLLPNASRRVLEVFCSYKVPNQTDFLPALEELVQGQPSEPFRDVYDFCNRFSHGEGDEVVSSLDGRVVHRQITRTMQFLRTVDGEHFKRMCKACDLAEGDLPALA